MPDLVTAVMPARNEEGFIERALESVLAQDHERLQVIVVDGGSTDRTPEIVAGYALDDPRVELLPNPAGKIPIALNIALAAAKGTWLVRVDSHSTIPPDYVSRAVRHLETGRWGGVGGRKDGVGITPAGRAISAALGSPFGVGGSLYHYGTEEQETDHVPFGCYPTALARELGGWDERLEANEDYEFDYRLRQAGHKLLFDPSMRIAWTTRQSIPDLFGQYRRYGRAKPYVLALHPRSARASHTAAPAMVGSWAVAALLSRRHPRLLLLVVAPYVLALTAATALTVRRTGDPQISRHLPAAFLAMHVGWGLGFWESAIKLASRRWRV